jgi:hypothetical protein
MTMPAPAARFTIEPTAVSGLAAELGALAAELSADADAARSAAVAFRLALEGEAGWSTGAAATAWASVEDVLARRTGAVADTLLAAVAAYRAEDVALAERVGTVASRDLRTPR